MSDTENIEVRQFWLGMSPYVVIEVREASDGSGDPALFMDSGGGAEEEPFALPLLILTEASAEKSPIAQMLRELRDAGVWDLVTLEAVTRQFNEDWIPYVQRWDES